MLRVGDRLAAGSPPDSTMLQRLRRLLTSVPSITVVGLLSVYLLVGFFVLPAVLAWQLEKQLAARGHGLQLGAVRFDPLRLTLEVDDLSLVDARGGAMLDVDHLMVALQWRSIIDRAWTISDVRLLAPRFRFVRARDGSHNFTALLAQFASDDPDPDKDGSGAMPPLRLQHLQLVNGSIAIFDQMLEQPLVSRIASLQMNLTDLSTRDDAPGRYQIIARTEAGESLELQGTATIGSGQADGELALRGLQVVTLVRGLNRELALQSPRGSIDLRGRFDLSIGADGVWTGRARDVQLALSDLFLQPPGGGEAPLLALQTLVLNDGRIDLARRVLRAESVHLADATAHARIDALGVGSWQAVLREVAQTRPASAAASAPPSLSTQAAAPASSPATTVPAAPPEAGKPWTVSVGDVRVDRLALAIRDARGPRSAKVAVLGLAAAVEAQLGGTDGNRVRLPQLRLALDGLVLQQGDAAVSMPSARLDPVSATTEGGSPLPAGNRSAELGHFVLQAQRLALDMAGGESTLSLDAMQSQAQTLQWLADGQTVALASATLDSNRLQLRQGAAGAQLEAQTPVLRLAGVVARRGADRADLAEWSLQGSRIDVRSGAASAVEIAFADMRGAGTQLSLARETDSMQVAGLSVGNEALELVLGTDETRFSGAGATATLAGMQATQAGQRLAVQDVRWKARGFDGSSSAPATGPARARARIDDSELGLASLVLSRVRPEASELASTTSAAWSAGSLALDIADGPLQLRGEAMALVLGETLLNDPSGQAAERVRLGEVDLSGAMFSLAGQTVTADRLRVRGLRASAWLDAQGRLNMLDVPGVARPDDATTTPTSRSGDRPWRIAVKSVDLRDAALRFEDRRRDPPLALGIDAITLDLAGLDTAAGAPAMQVRLGATLASGGELQAHGSAALDPQVLDLRLAVRDLALATLQPVLSDYLELTLTTGTASTQGRLIYGPQRDAAARLVYTGGLAIDNFQLEEVTPKRPFLAWESIRTDDLKLTLQPNRVDIGEVMLDKPVGRLIIAEDLSVNITDVLKKRRDGAASGHEDKAPAVEADHAEPADQFPVTVARVKVRDGQLEFADLSLRPQFGTRMHELAGVVTGLGTDANRNAQVQLDARVDKFGSARIRGQISVFEPERFTDIDMAFRNLDMSALSPYVVKFAGYEIKSGRLTLDLQYKVSDGRLQGENKLVMTKAELGRKVESPGALDLPLELALAILQDANGVIDIGVPVRGDLNDPQFDYGAVIVKAIGNLIGSIVTAPFRALAAMFGGGEKPIDTIMFEPGMATLAPPEQQKIETVARALKDRPNLVLKVAPVVAPGQDTPVLQSLAVRSEIARRMGLKLAPNEDPGPIDAANPRVPAAVEEAFGTRYAPAVFDLLEQRALEQAAREGAVNKAPQATDMAVASGAPEPVVSAGTRGRPATASAAGTAASAARVASSMPPPAFYQGLIDRMIKEQSVSEEMLAQLAARRAEAIVRAITGQNGGVPVARVQTGSLRTVTDATKSVVPLRLELDVAK